MSSRTPTDRASGVEHTGSVAEVGPRASRRTILAAGVGLAGAGLVSSAQVGGRREAAPAGRDARTNTTGTDRLYEISLAQWSLHRTINGGDLDPLDFPVVTRTRFGLDACEFVNSFFKNRARDEKYLSEMKKRAEDNGVVCLLIMCDGEGNLGDPNEMRRRQAVDNHYRWLAAAALLGCHSIRVNAASSGSFEEQQKLAADGLRRLTEVAAPFGLNVIVENHGGYSSHGEWLAGVMKLVDHPRCGTLPDFGNFCMDWSRASDPSAWYDRYKGVGELMPYARAVSAKSNEFSDSGAEVRTDYSRMMKIVGDAGYRGWVGIEWEGGGMSEDEGILATKRLLLKVRDELEARA